MLLEETYMGGQKQHQQTLSDAVMFFIQCVENVTTKVRRHKYLIINAGCFYFTVSVLKIILLPVVLLF